MDLATALLELFEAGNEIKIIGVRHGEKKHETLVTSEEMARAEESEKYFRIKPDYRDLNYGKDKDGLEKEGSYESYTSFNTKRLNIDEIKEILLRLDYIKQQLS